MIRNMCRHYRVYGRECRPGSAKLRYLRIPDLIGILHDFRWYKMRNFSVTSYNLLFYPRSNNNPTESAIYLAKKVYYNLMLLRLLISFVLYSLLYLRSITHSISGSRQWLIFQMMFFSVLFACSDSRTNIVNQREKVKVKDELSSASWRRGEIQQ